MYIVADFYKLNNFIKYNLLHFYNNICPATFTFKLDFKLWRTEIDISHLDIYRDYIDM